MIPPPPPPGAFHDSNSFRITNFRLIQTHRNCRRQFTFSVNDGKLSEGVENIVGKGKIA